MRQHYGSSDLSVTDYSQVGLRRTLGEDVLPESQLAEDEFLTTLAKAFSDAYDVLHDVLKCPKRPDGNNSTLREDFEKLGKAWRDMENGLLGCLESCPPPMFWKT